MSARDIVREMELCYHDRDKFELYYEDALAQLNNECLRSFRIDPSYLLLHGRDDLDYLLITHNNMAGQAQYIISIEYRLQTVTYGGKKTIYPHTVVRRGLKTPSYIFYLQYDRRYPTDVSFIFR